MAFLVSDGDSFAWSFGWHGRIATIVAGRHTNRRRRRKEYMSETTAITALLTIRPRKSGFVSHTTGRMIRASFLPLLPSGFSLLTIISKWAKWKQRTIRRGAPRHLLPPGPQARLGIVNTILALFSYCFSWANGHFSSPGYFVITANTYGSTLKQSGRSVPSSSCSRIQALRVDGKTWG